MIGHQVCIVQDDSLKCGWCSFALAKRIVRSLADAELSDIARSALGSALYFGRGKIRQP